MKERFDNWWDAQDIPELKEREKAGAFEAHFLEGPDEAVFAVDYTPSQSDQPRDEVAFIQAQIDALRNDQTFAVEKPAAKKVRFDGVEILKRPQGHSPAKTTITPSV